mmetsp:Transcript_17072/g.30882  ORF Transcript_17072/g.30882 Transcript_17072/m.30882 type:complete len:203 (-) Transcript_17072:97-705(-)|eukprot:CAMPEP_0198280654 /NCGR_PEP_ID=MMETSP1449-20131203/707_1 /TAXON_ID=420275 /ORGANISM="Attheya septentrionalis, Strain CCMP2084" /LENGTH=202 /DNA_ID=CAMNT_0043976079 /DNA_START=187 /DNA_END=795 /DNA_ORIENTATION=-
MSTLPPSTIAVDTVAILDACEMAELSAPTPMNDRGFIMLTQMACLLYLGEVGHARHLWRRTQNSPSAVNEDEGRQLALLWEAGRHMASGGDKCFGKFQECIDSSLQPLTTFASEIREEHRRRILGLWASAYKNINSATMSDLCDGEYLLSHGWTHQGELSVPPKTSHPPDDDFNMDGSSAIDPRIGELADIVGFMERTRMNA